MDSLILSITCLILFIFLVLVVAIGPRDRKPVAKPGLYIGPYLEPLENAPDPEAVVHLSRGDIKIGRDPKLAQLVFNDQTMSRLHARIVVRDNNYYLVDEGSAAGTYVNYERIGSEPRVLHDHDDIHFGRLHLRFHLPAGKEEHGDQVLSSQATNASPGDDDLSNQPYVPHKPLPSHQLPGVVPLRLDVAVPDQVYLGRAFELAVAVRQPLSDLLADEKLPRVRSGDILASPSPGQNYIGFRIHVSAPHCKIHDRDSSKFRLFLGQDSPVFYFHLTPLKPGELSIIVSVYQKKVQSGSARIYTLAQEEPVGQVSTEVISSNLVSEMKQQGNPIRRELISLYQRLVQYFNESELKELVFQLGIDYEDLPGQTKRDKVQELIKYLERRDGIQQLVALSERNRPNVVWQ